MKAIQLVAAAALILGGTTFSQGVADDTYWTDGDGTVVHVDVVDSNPDTPGCVVQMTTAGGSTSAVSGTASGNSTTEKPKAESAPASTTPAGEELDIKKKPNGESRPRIKKDGKWTYMRKTKKPKAGLQAPVNSTAGTGPRGASPGDEGTSLPD